MSLQQYVQRLRHELHWTSAVKAAISTVLLGILIVVGSRNLQDFDSALVGYTFACLFSTFGIVYRYSVWLTKPPTRRYWKRGWQLCFSPRLWKNLRSPRILASAVATKIVTQGFIFRRGFWRWAAHMLIASGCVLAALITFPLVFGWIHFELGQVEPVQTYVVWLLGFPVGELGLTGLISWMVFHGLVISSFLVLPGVMIAMYRRMNDRGAVAVQRFSRDFIPLIALFAIAFSGLLLWISYEFLEGYFYGVLAQLHAFTVIGTLIYLPFGKFFHIFQRPASIGIAYYKAANADRDPALCPVNGSAFAPRMQVDDLSDVLTEMGFDYHAPNPDAPQWNEISPQGRRMMIGHIHNRMREGRFS